MIRQVAGTIFHHANADVIKLLCPPVRDSGFAFVFRAVDFQPIGGAEGNVFQIQRKATFLRGWNIPARNAA